jgi:hypothetical protein
MRLAIAAAALAACSASAFAQPAAPSGGVTVESYYRIKWGSEVEFKRLYKANHLPILKELQRQGFITAMRMDQPFTHLAGGPRWDVRVTITYRDAESAVGSGGAMDKAYEAATKKLFPDNAKLDLDETRRFSLLEDHWDVVVIEAP